MTDKPEAKVTISHGDEGWTLHYGGRTAGPYEFLSAAICRLAWRALSGLNQKEVEAWEANPDKAEKKPALLPAKVLSAILGARKTLLEPEPPSEGELSGEDELLRTSLLGFDTFKALIRIVGKTVKRDEKAVSLELLHMLSAYTSDPASIGVEAPTSEGKTYPAVQVAKLFPREDVWMLGGLSPTALAHDYGDLIDKDDQPLQPQLDRLADELRNQKDPEERQRIRAEMTELRKGSKYVIDLEDKILIFLEDPRAETWARLRPILSHDVEETTYKFTDRAGRGGPLRMMTTSLRGWPVVVYFSAVGKASPFWNQMATRFTVISPEMTEQKYGAAIELTAEKKGLPHPVFAAKHGLDERELAKRIVNLIRGKLRTMRSAAREATGAFSPNLFWMPFYEEIGVSFPRKAGRHMRDVGRFLTVIQMSAAVNVLARPVLKIGEREQIIITFEDYIRAVDLYLSDMAETIFTGVPAHIIDFFKKVLIPLGREGKILTKEFTEDGETSSTPILPYSVFTINDMVDKHLDVYGRSRSGDTLRRRYLPQLMNLGVIDQMQDPNDRRRNIYRVLREEVLDEETGQSGIYEIADNFSLDILKERWNELRNNIGAEDLRIVDYDGSPLTVEDLHRIYYRDESAPLLFSNEKKGPHVKGDSELAASSKLGDYPARKNRQEQLNIVLHVIKETQEQMGTSDETLKNLLEDPHGINNKEADKLIGILVRDGTIYSPRPGYYRATT